MDFILCNSQKKKKTEQQEQQQQKRITFWLLCICYRKSNTTSDTYFRDYICCFCWFLLRWSTWILFHLEYFCSLCFISKAWAGVIRRLYLFYGFTLAFSYRITFLAMFQFRLENMIWSLPRSLRSFFRTQISVKKTRVWNYLKFRSLGKKSIVSKMFLS